MHRCTNHLITGLFTKQQCTTATVSRILFNIQQLNKEIKKQQVLLTLRRQRPNYCFIMTRATTELRDTHRQIFQQICNVNFVQERNIFPVGNILRY